MKKLFDEIEEKKVDYQRSVAVFDVAEKVLVDKKKRYFFYNSMLAQSQSNTLFFLKFGTVEGTARSNVCVDGEKIYVQRGKR